MPVPTHFKFTVRGTFDATPETWVTGCHFSRANQGEADAGYDDINSGSVTAAVVAFFGSSIFTQDLKVKDWRMYQIGTNGRMETNAPLMHDFVTDGPSGTAGAWKYPPQIACVVSLVAANRGPAKHGRMYLPSMAKPLGSGGRISAGDAGEIREATTTFLKAVADSIDLEVLTQSAAVNVSTGPPGSSTGTIQEVDHLEVGRALDTMRSRRRALLEDYSVGGHIDW
jgi:hypothetical protein